MVASNRLICIKERKRLCRDITTSDFWNSWKIAECKPRMKSAFSNEILIESPVSDTYLTRKPQQTKYARSGKTWEKRNARRHTEKKTQAESQIRIRSTIEKTQRTDTQEKKRRTERRRRRKSLCSTAPPAESRLTVYRRRQVRDQCELVARFAGT